MRAAMHRWTMALAVPLAMALAGCFISEGPLIGDGETAFPFEKLTYKAASEEKPAELVRDGNTYVITDPEGKVRVEMRFKDLGDGLYLAQMSGEEDGKVSILYSVLKVDFEKKTAESYRAVGRDDLVRDGLRKCGDGMLCIDDLDVYIDLAKGTIAAGEKPDVAYTILTME